MAWPHTACTVQQGVKQSSMAQCHPAQYLAVQHGTARHSTGETTVGTRPQRGRWGVGGSTAGARPQQGTRSTAGANLSWGILPGSLAAGDLLQGVEHFLEFQIWNRFGTDLEQIWNSKKCSTPWSRSPATRLPGKIPQLRFAPAVDLVPCCGLAPAVDPPTPHLPRCGLVPTVVSPVLCRAVPCCTARYCAVWHCAMLDCFTPCCTVHAVRGHAMQSC